MVQTIIVSGPLSGGQINNIDGYRIGGGAEFTNGSNFARLEYRYSDYGKYVYREGGIELDTGVKMSRHQIAVTGGFHF